jgi:hypothetical protein
VSLSETPTGSLAGRTRSRHGRAVTVAAAGPPARCRAAAAASLAAGAGRETPPEAQRHWQVGHHGDRDPVTDRPGGRGGRRRSQCQDGDSLAGRSEQ